MNVLLAGKLASRRPAQPIALDGTYQITMDNRSTASDLIAEMGLPREEVALVVRNGRSCGPEEALESGDRIVVVHPNAAGMWRMLDTWNRQMSDAFDYGGRIRRRRDTAAA